MPSTDTNLQSNFVIGAGLKFCRFPNDKWIPCFIMKVPPDGLYWTRMVDSLSSCMRKKRTARHPHPIQEVVKIIATFKREITLCFVKRVGQRALAFAVSQLLQLKIINMPKWHSWHSLSGATPLVFPLALWLWLRDTWGFRAEPPGLLYLSCKESCSAS